MTLPTSLALTTIAGQISATPHNNNNTAIQTAVNDTITYLGGVDAYTTYVPTFTCSSGTAPAIGNATVVARWAKIGKVTHASGTITFGSTSTFGNGGAFLFALPAAVSTQRLLNGMVEGIDQSSGNRMLGVAQTSNSTSLMDIAYQATWLGTGTNVINTAPWTWASGDQISWNLLYEAA